MIKQVNMRDQLNSFNASETKFIGKSLIKYGFDL
jgi:hypothetical protein